MFTLLLFGRDSKIVCLFLRVKKSFKCHCGKTYGTSQSLRKHAIQCHNAAVITAQVKEILQQGNESGTVNGLVQPYQSIQLKQISSAGTPLKTLVVSTKPTATVQPSIQSPQRLMIQLSDLSSITSSSWRIEPEQMTKLLFNVLSIYLFKFFFSSKLFMQHMRSSEDKKRFQQRAVLIKCDYCPNAKVIVTWMDWCYSMYKYSLSVIANKKKSCIKFRISGKFYQHIKRE